eukprot:1480168-Alexandrium_andersonii.AAC.1
MHSTSALATLRSPFRRSTSTSLRSSSRVSTLPETWVRGSRSPHRQGGRATSPKVREKCAKQ